MDNGLWKHRECCQRWRQSNFQNFDISRTQVHQLLLSLSHRWDTKKWKHTISNWLFRELYKWEVTQTDWGDMEGAQPAVLQLLEGLHAPTTPPGVFSSEACVFNISLLIILFIFSRIYADKHDRRHSVPDSSDWREGAITFHVSVENCNESWLIISLHANCFFFF